LRYSNFCIRFATMTYKELKMPCGTRFQRAKNFKTYNSMAKVSEKTAFSLKCTSTSNQQMECIINLSTIHKDIIRPDIRDDDGFPKVGSEILIRVQEYRSGDKVFYVDWNNKNEKVQGAESLVIESKSTLEVPAGRNYGSNSLNRRAQLNEIAATLQSFVLSKEAGVLQVGITDDGYKVGFSYDVLKWKSHIDYEVDVRNRLGQLFDSHYFASKISFKWEPLENGMWYLELRPPLWPDILFVNGTDLYVRVPGGKQKLKNNDIISFIHQWSNKGRINC